MANNWYKIINGNNIVKGENPEKEALLEQGDILEGLEVVIPTVQFLKGETSEIETEKYDLVILTQSCDLANKKTPWIQVTPVHSLSAMQEKYSAFKDLKNLESIRRGFQHKYHMLNECSIQGSEFELSIIDFRNIFTLPYEYVQEMSTLDKNRRRMESPYKEHLAQAYARFFMRVGLPTDIPSFV